MIRYPKVLTVDRPSIMQAAFWHQRWQENQIGFHLPAPHLLLTESLTATPLPANSTVFVPLCGKTLDIAYLLTSGYQVRAIELSEMAVKQLFDSLGVRATVTEQDGLLRYTADKLVVYVGDVFDLTQACLGEVDWVYDRAALVALPEKMREQYVLHLQQITNTASQLLITIEYDQAQLNGPPFSIDANLVKHYYQSAYNCELIAQQIVYGGLKGKVDAVEKLWRLTKP